MAVEPRTIDTYINDAKRALGLKSDRELDRWLGFKGPAVSAWRTRRAWPADDTMIRVAEAGGNDPRLAVCYLHQWSAATPKVRAVYRAIADAVAKTAAALAMLGAATATTPANATRTIQHAYVTVSASSVTALKIHFNLHRVGVSAIGAGRCVGQRRQFS